MQSDRCYKEPGTEQGLADFYIVQPSVLHRCDLTGQATDHLIFWTEEVFSSYSFCTNFPEITEIG